MTILNDLPYETLVETLSLLSCADLLSATRVSCRLHHISQPLLYKAPCLTKTPSSGAARPSLEIFLRTLLTPGRESLASHVRSLSLQWDGIVAEPASQYPTDSIAVITAMASKLNIRNPLKSQGAQLMLLLDLLPRLHVLRLSPPNSRSSFTRLLEASMAAGMLPRGLQSLREIHCPRADTGNEISPVRLLKFFKLPCIRSIDVPSVDRYNLSVPTMEAAAATSPVTHLRLSHATSSLWVLGYVLGVPIALTHFSYSAVSDGCFNLPCFMATLAPLRPSLQYLHLDFGDVGFTSSDEEEEFQLPYDEGSLREWPVLRTLSCSLMPLLGKEEREGSPRLANVLPPSLRELEVLQDCHWEIWQGANQVVEMLAQKESAVPHLEKLAMVMGWGGSQRVVYELTAACEVAGVSFVKESFCW